MHSNQNNCLSLSVAMLYLLHFGIALSYLGTLVCRELRLCSKVDKDICISFTLSIAKVDLLCDIAQPSWSTWCYNAVQWTLFFDLNVHDTDHHRKRPGPQFITPININVAGTVYGMKPLRRWNRSTKPFLVQCTIHCRPRVHQRAFIAVSWCFGDRVVSTVKVIWCTSKT